MSGKLLTVAQVADILQRSEKFVRAEIGRKNLRAIDLGKGYGIEPEDLQIYIQQRQTKEKGELAPI